MAEIDLFHFRPGKTGLHRINTAVKYLSAIILSIAIFNGSPVELIVVTSLFLTGIFIIFFPLSVHSIISRIWNLRAFFLFLLIISVARGLSIEGTPLPFIPFFSNEGLISGAIYSWKLVLLLIIGQLLVSTTEPSELHGAVYRVLKPLPMIKAGQIATMVSLTISFIPLIFDQYLEIRQAAESRLGSRSRNPVKKIQSIAIPLMQTTLSRADEVASAMESRCYREDPTIPDWEMQLRDWMFLCMSLLLSATIFLSNI